MNKVARLVTRAGGDKDGLIIGVRTKSFGDLLPEGRVYEIQEALGELVIKNVGPSCVGKTIIEEGKAHNFCWGNSINDLLHHKGLIFLIEEEYTALCKESNNVDSD